MQVKAILTMTSMILLFTMLSYAVSDTKPEAGPQWEIHDMNRPQPPVVAPGEQPGAPSSDAVVLFDGSNLDAWLNGKGEAAQWKVENGYMEVVAKTGAINTKQAFGSCQLHIEWATPEVAVGNGQERGNSGIFFMTKYELQILDSYENPTYPDGQAGSIYGQYPPLVNVSRRPGQWQSYDVIFHRPVFDDGGNLLKAATITVFQNGVLVQDHVEIWGATAHKAKAAYQAHPDKLPLALQDHGNPTRFRNIWIRELAE